MAFSEKLQSSRAGQLYRVHGDALGHPAWHYVLVEKPKLPLFERALTTDTLDVAQYGEILASGWGAQPPAETVEAMAKRFGQHS